MKKSSLASCLHSQHISPTGKQSTCCHLNCVLSTEVPRHQESVAGGTGKENTSFWAEDRLNSFSCFPHNQSPKPSMSSQSSFSTVTFWRVPSNVTAQSVFFLKPSPLFPVDHLQLAFSPHNAVLLLFSTCIFSFSWFCVAQSSHKFPTGQLWGQAAVEALVGNSARVFGTRAGVWHQWSFLESGTW